VNAGLDGMRWDVDGNLYITRSAKGTVAIVSPQGKILHEVDVLGKHPTNREFSRSVRDSRQPALLSSVRCRGASDSEPEYHTTDS
jgi:hypothetical protein